MNKGLVFDFHRGTTHDGPGMRTTVFLKGCPLHCQWCHNPESINPNREIQWDEKKCIGCLQCVNNCLNGAIEERDGRLVINHDKCQQCYICTDNCPSKAISVVGKYWEIPDLVKEACKDKMFFGDFKGGVTISGGEPVLQYHFLIEFIEELKKEGVNIAIDTCGFGKREVYEKIYPYVDVFLYDIKLMDSKLHEQYTGVNNNLILSNLKNIANKARVDGEKRIWIRTPLIPGATATIENIDAIGSFIRRELIDVIERWELCAFNNVCKEKYQKLDKNWKFENEKLMTIEEVGELSKVAKSYVGDLLVVSGLTRKEE